MPWRRVARFPRDSRPVRRPAPPAQLKPGLRPVRAAARFAFRRVRARSDRGQFHRCPASAGAMEARSAASRNCLAYPAGASQFAPSDTLTIISKTAAASHRQIIVRQTFMRQCFMLPGLEAYVRLHLHRSLPARLPAVTSIVRLISNGRSRASAACHASCPTPGSPQRLRRESQRPARGLR